MKNIKSRLAIALLGVLATTAIVAGASYASEGDHSYQGKNMDPEKLEAMQEHKAQMQEIFENEDYNGWKILMEEKVARMQERVNEFSTNITQERFGQMSEIHALMQEGKYEEAKALKQELGLGTGTRGFGGMGRKGYQHLE